MARLPIPSRSEILARRAKSATPVQSLPHPDAAEPVMSPIAVTSPAPVPVNEVDEAPASSPSLPFSHQPPESPSSSLPEGAKRPKERRRGNKATRGLPLAEILHDLARVYLQQQRLHWPELAKSGLIADPNDSAAIDRMVEVFISRHRDQLVPSISAAVRAACLRLAAAYSRFSSEHSSPNSIADQVTNELRLAKQNDEFIPWEWCFADYAISGVDNERSDYVNAKKLIADSSANCRTIYIDDFTRASRETLEWWKLAALIKRYGKNLLGASDGFDLSHPNYEILITIYTLLSKLFLKSLAEKVRRGQSGAARRRTAVNHAGFGHMLVPKRDAAGKIIVETNGQRTMVYALDSEYAEYLQEAADRVNNKLESFGKIIRSFNELRVGERQTWTDGTLRDMLLSPRMIGIMIFNRTRRERDPETGKIVVIENPRREWIVWRDRSLQILDIQEWKKLRRKYGRPKGTKGESARSRNMSAPTTSLSGLLYCGSCGRELILGRSADSYKMFVCPSGRDRAHGCKLWSYKSEKIVMTALMDFVRDRLITEEFIRELVHLSNDALAAAVAAQSSTDAAKKRAELERRQGELKSQIDALTDLGSAASGRDSRSAILEKLDLRVREKCEIDSQLSAIRTGQRQLDVPLITEDDVRKQCAALSDLFSTAQADANAGAIGEVAVVLRKLLGKVTIEDAPRIGRKGADWFANITPPLATMLPKESFSSGVSLTPVRIPLDVSKAVRIAPKVKALLDAASAHGLTQSIESIATTLGETYFTVEEAIRYLKTGKHTPRVRRPSKGPRRPRPSVPAYIEKADEVARLVDVEKLSMPEIAKQLGLNVSTGRRAYRHHHKESIQQLVTDGKVLRRTPAPKVKPADEQRIISLREQSRTIGEIAEATGFGSSTILRVLKRHGFGSLRGGGKSPQSKL